MPPDPTVHKKHECIIMPHCTYNITVQHLDFKWYSNEIFHVPGKPPHINQPTHRNRNVCWIFGQSCLKALHIMWTVYSNKVIFFPQINPLLKTHARIWSHMSILAYKENLAQWTDCLEAASSWRLFASNMTTNSYSSHRSSWSGLSVLPECVFRSSLIGSVRSETNVNKLPSAVDFIYARSLSIDCCTRVCGVLSQRRPVHLSNHCNSLPSGMSFIVVGRKIKFSDTVNTDEVQIVSRSKSFDPVGIISIFDVICV